MSTPDATRGSRTQSHDPNLPERPATTAVSAEANGTETPHAEVSPAPFQLAFDAGFLAAGDAGFPLRIGLLGQFRPFEELAVGLQLETNFSDEFLALARLEARFNPVENFGLFAAAQVGIRALFGQDHPVGAEDQPVPVNGILPAIGVEAGGTFRIEDFGIGIFARALYSPPAGVSVPAIDAGSGHNPDRGLSLEGFEFTVGLRFELDLPPQGSRRPQEEASDEVTAPRHIPQTQEALQGLRSSLDSVIRQAETLPPPSGQPEVSAADTASEHPSREAVLSAIRRDLTSLYDTTESLDEEISASINAYRRWNEGADLLNDLYIEMDRIFPENTGELNLNDLNAFAARLSLLIEDNDSLRYHLSHQREANYLSLDRFSRTLEQFTSQLQTLQGQVHRGRVRGIHGSDLNPVIQRLTQARTSLGEFSSDSGSHDFRVSTEQVDQWRHTLDAIGLRIRQLNGDVPEALKTELQTRYQALRESFTQELQNMQLEAGYQSRYESMVEAMYGFHRLRIAANEGNRRQRNERASAALEQIRIVQDHVQNSSPGFRQRFRRGFRNFTQFLSEFLASDLPRRHHPWYEVSQVAISILRELDPQYQAPEIAEPRQVRRRRSSTRARRGRRAERPGQAPTTPRQSSRRAAPASPSPSTATGTTPLYDDE